MAENRHQVFFFLKSSFVPIPYPTTARCPNFLTHFYNGSFSPFIVFTRAISLPSPHSHSPNTTCKSENTARI